MIKYYYSNNRIKLNEIGHPKAGCLVYIEDPSDKELKELSREHKLDIDLLTDGLDQNEAPRIEEWEKRIYIYSRHVMPEDERITTAPVLIVFGLNMIYIISRKPFTILNKLFTKFENINTSKRAMILLQILNEVNLGYKNRINNVAKRMWAIRSQLDKAHIDNKDFIEFIDMEEDLNDFLMALEPMNNQLNHLLTGRFITLYEDDKDLMEDLELGSEELIVLASGQLKTIKNVREAYSTITANNLNKVFKLMTSITILLGICTLITSTYGMNVRLPLDRHPQAFWFIMGLTFGLIIFVAVYFKIKKWF